MITTVSFVSLWLTNGSSVVGGSVGSMILGQLGIGVYAILFALLAPHIGIAGAAIAALAIGILTVSLPTFFGLRARGDAVRKMKTPVDVGSTDGSLPARTGQLNEEESPSSLEHRSDDGKVAAGTAMPEMQSARDE